MTGVAKPVWRVLAAVSPWFANRTLTRCGLTLLALVPAGVLWAWCDPRKVSGEAVATKPTRFALSLGLYMLTASAMFNQVRPERRSALLPRMAVWTMVVGSTVELSCIVLQAARGRRSHFNRSTPGDTVIYAVMGAFAVLFVGAVLPLAWEIARRPDEHADRNMVHATVAGLLLTFVAGGGTGALMSGRVPRTLGRGNARLPLLGWDMSGGDIRVPHFFGIHAMQALPMIAASANALSPRRARPAFLVGALAYGLLTAGLLYRSLRDKPAPLH